MYSQELPYHNLENSTLVNLVILDSKCPCVPLTSARDQGLILTFVLFTDGNHWNLNKIHFKYEGKGH